MSSQNRAELLTWEGKSKEADVADQCTTTSSCPLFKTVQFGSPSRLSPRQRPEFQLGLGIKCQYFCGTDRIVVPILQSNWNFLSFKTTFWYLKRYYCIILLLCKDPIVLVIGCIQACWKNTRLYPGMALTTAHIVQERQGIEISLMRPSLNSNLWQYAPCRRLYLSPHFPVIILNCPIKWSHKSTPPLQVTLWL